jgi:hypothetical protein
VHESVLTGGPVHHTMAYERSCGGAEGLLVGALASSNTGRHPHRDRDLSRNSCSPAPRFSAGLLHPLFKNQ